MYIGFKFPRNNFSILTLHESFETKNGLDYRERFSILVPSLSILSVTRALVLLIFVMNLVKDNYYRASII
jgi:uncharacterized integral membrane protein